MASKLPEYVTRADIAQVLGISPTRVSILKQDGVLPDTGGRGRYHLVNCVQAYMGFNAGHRPTEDEAPRGRPADVRALEDARLKRAQANKAEMDVDARRGELLAREDVLDAWSSRLTVLRTRLLNLPNRLGPMLAGESDERACRKMVDDEVRDTLTDLADYDGGSSTTA